MIKFFVRSLFVTIIGLTLLVSSLSAYQPNTMYREQVAVIMYHHVDDTIQSSGTITVDLFQRQLTYLQQQGYQFITLDQFKQYLAGGPVPDNAVLVTFDDGYESFYSNAYPVLSQLNIPAVNFAITKDTLNPQASYIPAMSQQQIAEMITAAPGRIEVQCHTHALHDKVDGQALLTARLDLDSGKRESEEDYRQRIMADTRTCRSVLEQVNPSPIDSLAYPFGIYDRDAAEALQSAGIEYAFTIAPGMATRQTDRLAIPRINAGGPYISPAKLHKSIQNQIQAVHHNYDRIPLREMVENWGGEVAEDSEGLIVIRYEGREWKLRPGSRTVLHQNNSLTIGQPVQVIEGKAYARWSDIEKLLFES
ncbi:MULTISPECIES: polysaccharide deacetylase family protein [Paenibacillus]|uniref:Polysaccharide deacetylase family protein n=1 Tax=Paenibacillus residui TaxID=629724 RepID=A0ABW3DB15_9BACL